MAEENKSERTEQKTSGVAKEGGEALANNNEIKSEATPDKSTAESGPTTTIPAGEDEDAEEEPEFEGWAPRGRITAPVSGNRPKPR